MEEKELLTSKMILARINDAQITTKEKNIIGTDALATCIGVLLYNEEKKTAIVAHVEPDKLDAIDKIFEIIIKNKLWSTKFKYLIIPGYYQEHYNTKELIEERLAHLTPFTQDEIPENAIITNEEFTSREFAFDAEAGKFVTDKVYFGMDYYKINQNEPNMNKHR